VRVPRRPGGEQSRHFAARFLASRTPQSRRLDDEERDNVELVLDYYGDKNPQ
jgi:hypothetical protein